MELLCNISEKGEERTLKGVRGEIKVVDVTLKSGADQVRASAFDDLAKAIVDGQLHEGALYKASVTFTIRETEKGKFQSCRIDRMDLLYEFIPQF